MIVEDKRHLQLRTHSRGNIQFMEILRGGGEGEEMAFGNTNKIRSILNGI